MGETCVLSGWRPCDRREAVRQRAEYSESMEVEEFLSGHIFHLVSFRLEDLGWGVWVPFSPSSSLPLPLHSSFPIFGCYVAVSHATSWVWWWWSWRLIADPLKSLLLLSHPGTAAQDLEREGC